MDNLDLLQLLTKNVIRLNEEIEIFEKKSADSDSIVDQSILLGLIRARDILRVGV